MTSRFQAVLLIAAAAGVLSSCGHPEPSAANSTADPVTVGVTKVGRTSIERKLTVSSELVPFQEIDVYAKESGFVKTLSVDYGSRVKAGQVLAVLEIPELQLQLAQDDAAIKNAQNMITHAEHELNRVQATANVYHLQYERLNGVAKSKPAWSRSRKWMKPRVKTWPAKRRWKLPIESRIHPKPASGGAGQARARQSDVRLRQNHRAFRRHRHPALRQLRDAPASRNQFEHPGHAAG